MVSWLEINTDTIHFYSVLFPITAKIILSKINKQITISIQERLFNYLSATAINGGKKLKNLIFDDTENQLLVMSTFTYLDYRKKIRQCPDLAGSVPRSLVNSDCTGGQLKFLQVGSFVFSPFKYMLNNRFSVRHLVSPRIDRFNGFK